jgi:hypothetical protein
MHLLGMLTLLSFGAAAALAPGIALREAIVNPSPDASPTLLAQLVDECCAARVPFRPELLGDGQLWRATPVKGETPRWQRNRLLLPFLRNRAGQAYTLGEGSCGTVVNYGEVFGRALYFKAEGSFQPADMAVEEDAAAEEASSFLEDLQRFIATSLAAPRAREDLRCPVDFDVAISQGGFVLGGTPFLSSAISGPGYLRCLYIDEGVRIFESPKDSPDRWEESGLVVVQVRDDLFNDPVEGNL